MRIKTFYSKTMSEALREIRDTLGPDALLLSSKEIPRRSGMWGRSAGFEVVAAVDRREEIDTLSPGIRRLAERRDVSQICGAGSAEESGAIAATYSPASLLAPALSAAAGKRAIAVKKLPEACAEREILSANELPVKELAPAGVYRELLDCGVESHLARALIADAWGRLTAGQRRNRPALLRAVTHSVLARVAPSSIQNEMPGKKVVAFVGPTGVGKTTSIAKLAARLALEKKKKVLLITLDGYRIGAVEQLRSYAGLIGVPFRFADQVSELPRVIDENRQRDYILIDTAGRGPRDMAAMNPLADFLRQSESVERHLVLSAGAKEPDLRRMVDQFECCSPDHLLFTKLDETSTPGPILNELVRTQKQFSYYTDGQRVPDDLHAVPQEQIMDIVLNRTENAFKE